MSYRTVVDNSGKTVLNNDNKTVLSLLEYIIGFIKIVRHSIVEFLNPKIKVDKHIQ